jgi:hypothetical protein
MTADEQAALDSLNASTDPQAQYSAIIAIGKASLTGLASAIEPYLQNPDPELRSAAIRTLAFYWRLPQYRSVAEKMMREEPDELTRSVAVMGWAGYDVGSKNRETLRRLYKAVIDDTEATPVRDQAYLNFFAVYLPSAVGRPTSAYHVGRRFEDGVDWARLDAAMQEIGVEHANTESLARTIAISVRDPMTSVALMPGHFDVICEGRAVRGALNNETWARAVGAIDLAGFPIHSDARSSDSVEISCVRDGDTSTIVVAHDSSKYRDIVRLTTSIAERAIPELHPTPQQHQGDILRIASGQGRVAASRFGRVELEIASDDTFRARHETGRGLRSWRGRLVPGTFQRAVKEMTAGGFPNVKPLGPLPPGSAPRELGWDRGARNESVRLADDDRNFDQLDTIFSSILTVLDEALARLPPGVTSPVIEWHDDQN